MTTSMRWAALVAHLFLFAAAVGCGDVNIHGPDWDWDDNFPEPTNTDASAEASFHYELQPAATLSLIGVAGSVSIEGSESRTSILVEGTRRVWSESTADAEARLSDLHVSVQERAGTVFVETRRPDKNWGRRYEIDYRIAVPADIDVTVRHASGPIEVRFLEGDVEVHAVAGDVTLDRLEGDVGVTTVAGEIQASVALPLHGVIGLTSSTGDIVLEVPTNTSANLHATTLTGVVRLLNLNLHDEDPRLSVVRGRMAAGEGTINIQTTGGDITVQGESPLAWRIK